jgi:hypothetical protein
MSGESVWDAADGMSSDALWERSTVSVSCGAAGVRQLAGAADGGEETAALDDEDLDDDDLDDEDDLDLDDAEDDDDDLDEFDDDELDDDDDDDDDADEIDFTEDRYGRIPGEDDGDE